MPVVVNLFVVRQAHCLMSVAVMPPVGPRSLVEVAMSRVCAFAVVSVVKVLCALMTAIIVVSYPVLVMAVAPAILTVGLPIMPVAFGVAIIAICLRRGVMVMPVSLVGQGRCEDAHVHLGRRLAL